MALINTISENNLVRETSLSVTYSKKRIPASYTYQEAVATETTITAIWELHRYATKSWKFVGMDRTAAETAAASLRTYYTRTIRGNTWNAEGESAGTFSHPNIGSMPMCDIAVVHVGGCMYEIQCRLNEDDTYLSVSEASPASCFGPENARGYSEIGATP